MQIVESILKRAVATQVAKANDLHPEVVRKLLRDFKAYQKESPVAVKPTWTTPKSVAPDALFEFAERTLTRCSHCRLRRSALAIDAVSGGVCGPPRDRRQARSTECEEHTRLRVVLRGPQRDG
jgi:hypothetical protein